YNANGATAGSVPIDNNKYLMGSSASVLGNIGGLARARFTFAGWNISTNGTGAGYAGGSPIILSNSNVILYALWTQNPTYTVIYNANGSTGGSVPVDGNN